MTVTYVVFSTVGHPTLFEALARLTSVPSSHPFVVLDPRGMSEKDWEIWGQRTGSLRPDSSWERDDFQLKFPNVDFVIADHGDREVERLVADRGVQLGFNHDTSIRYASSLFELFEFGLVNVHPGLLPSFPGSCAVEWALHFGRRVGSTVHLIEEGLDSGPIIRRESYLFPSGWDYRMIRRYTYARQLVLMGWLLECLTNGTNLIATAETQPSTSTPLKPMGNDTLGLVIERVRLADGESFSSKIDNPAVLNIESIDFRS